MRPCWECREEAAPAGAQILERCEAHLRAALRLAMGLDGETRIPADALPLWDDHLLGMEGEI
jgi:hypothetical protein